MWEKVNKTASYIAFRKTNHREAFYQTLSHLFRVSRHFSAQKARKRTLGRRIPPLRHETYRNEGDCSHPSIVSPHYQSYYTTIPIYLR